MQRPGRWLPVISRGRDGRSYTWLGSNEKRNARCSGTAQGRAEDSLNDLEALLSGNVPLTCRLFRALFEHMLGFALPSGGQQGNVSLVNELTGSREHSRSFLSTALFILGAEIDREHLMSFMMQEGLFGMPTFEHMLQNRDYCEAFHSFRRLERAFMGSPATEEAQLRNRLDKFNAQFGGSRTARRSSKRMRKTRQRSMRTWPQPICWKLWHSRPGA